MDVRVYGARSGERLHLVSVTSMRADSVALPSSLLGGSGFRLIVDPVGAVRPYATSRIRADVGQVVSLRVENALAQSSVWVH